MAPRSRARAAQAASSSASALKIACLPDAVLVHCLGFLTLQQRQQAALVSRRFAALCCIPELLRDVATPYVDSLPALLSFMAWLVRHGRHVLRLDFTARPAPPLDEGCWTAAVVSCLAASGTAGQLAELQFSYLLPLPLHTEWLAIMRSLRCLCLDGDAIHISPAISGLTALQSLELSSMEIINLTAGARLPTSMTRLCVTTDGAEQMPEQFAQLPRLQRLRLDGCRYSAESMQQLSALSSSLTRLDTISMELPAAALSALTRLQHLDWYGTDSTAVEGALQHLTGLTCLVLFATSGLDPLPPALSGLSRLRLCSLERWGELAEGTTYAPPLPSGPWLRSLQWLSVGAGTLLSSAAVLEGAAALECLSIAESPVADVDWRSAAADAFFAWLARHPSLRCFSVDTGRPKQVCSRFFVRVLQLGRSRPALRVQCPGLRDEGESLVAHIKATYPF